MKAVLIILGLGLALTFIPTLIYFLGKGLPRLRQLALGLCLSAITFTLLFTSLESFWQLAGGHLPIHLKPTIPPELRRRNIHGTSDYYWHGHLHRFTEEGFRGGNWPTRSPQVFRVVALGDSLTYGEGVAEEEAYPQVLHEMLNNDYRAEVLNLGICGHQVSDIRKVLDKYLDVLNPDLVTYGMCLNDFLPSRMPQKEDFSLSVPSGIKNYLALETATFALLTRKYDELLRRLHLRRDFFTDLLISLEKNPNLKQKFAEDCTFMSRAMTARGKPPIMALVVTQCPHDQRGVWLADISQDLMRQAGMTVLNYEPYFRGMEGEEFTVSSWEGHPNVRCHRIFARILYDGLIKFHGDLLSRYRRI